MKNLPAKAGVKSDPSKFKKHQSGAIIMLELPTEQYFEASARFLKTIVNQGREGIYISFQRPFQNISSLLERQGINTRRLIFIDVATAAAGEPQLKNAQCLHLSPEINIDELVKAIYTSLEKLKGKRKFIFIDSLTTITLYKPLSEVLRFSDYLIRELQHREVADVIFNVAKDLAQKKFIRDIALQANKIIQIGK